MITYLPQSTQNELAQLSQRFGQPLTRIVDLHSNTLFDPLNKTDRYGEVCMVVQRPNGHLLTMTKTFYPPQAYRLLTGGIHHGEAIFDALLRETHEETGLDVEVTRFLAIAAYRTPHTQPKPVFYSFAFLLKETGGTLGTIDEDEQVEDFREIEPGQLPAVAANLEHVTHQYSNEIRGNWSDWGEFRASIHHLVYEALNNR
ncbi:MAG: NUDIX hydrolase [Ktedonobacteraceae bacterium]|nr:NUDIX hydrolase [Ktedonobacteraceae bacterium]